MLKKHTNRFLSIVTEAGLDPRDFNAYYEQSYRERPFFIELRNSPVFFCVKESEFGCLQFHYSFGNKERSVHPEQWFPHSACSIEEVFEAFHDWLTSVASVYAEDRLEPDLWEIASSGKECISFATSDSEGTMLFTDEEKSQLLLAINEFRLLVDKAFQPNEDEMKVVDVRLEYISEAVDRLNRFDWRALVFSSLVSISIALTLNTEQGEKLFRLFKQAFSTVVYLIKQ